MNRKKRIIITCVSLALIIVLIGAIGIFAIFRNELGVIRTVEKLEEGLYTMEYSGDYGFDALMESGGVSDSNELAAYISSYISKGFYTFEPESLEYGCSTISAINEAGGHVFGRNFDWEDCMAMVVTTIPENGYKSISTVNLGFLGFGDDYVPEGLGNSFLALAAPFVPLDGMNEKGLCVADLIVPNLAPTNQNTEKPDITTTLALRLILDRAATVDEAIYLLRQYDMHSDIGTMHHIAVSDATGRSVVIEYLDNKMFVTETSIVTNFILTEGDYCGIGSEESKDRYDILNRMWSAGDGVLDETDIKDALEAVSQSSGGFDPEWNTPWSIVYNQSSLELTFYHREDYTEGYTFKIF